MLDRILSTSLLTRFNPGFLCAGMVLVLCTASTCPLAPEPVPICQVSSEIESDLARPYAIIVARVDEGIRIRGFAGAVATGVMLNIGLSTDVSLPVDVSSDGSFDMVWSESDATSIDLTFRRDDVEEVIAYRVREPSEALACVSGAAMTTGTLPNDLALTNGCDEAASAALIPLSGDGSLDVINLATGDHFPSTAYFPPLENIAASPWGVAVQAGGERAAVTLQGFAAVALIDPCRGEVLHQASPRSASGQLLAVPVEPPIALRDPRDVNGDGVSETIVARMLVRGPQALVFTGTRIIATFTNFLEPALDEDRPMGMGPGVVVAFEIDNDVLVPAGQLILDAKNPQGIALAPDGRVWVSATGSYAYEDGRLVAADNGALFAIEPERLEIVQRIDFARFAPATPAITDTHLVVGSTLRGSVAVLPLTALSIDDATIINLQAGDGLSTVFEAEVLLGNLVAVTHFETDRLRVIDAESATLDPWPFSEAPLLVGPGGSAFRGLQALALDNLRGAALLGLSAEVVALDFRSVFGP